MKYKHIALLVAVLVSAFAPIAPAQSLFQVAPTAAQTEVARIDQHYKQTIDVLEAKLRTIYREITAGTPEQIQARLDEMGTNASVGLGQYIAAYTLVKNNRPNSTIPEASVEVFVPNQNGTVTYVAPPAPEPEE